MDLRWHLVGQWLVVQAIGDVIPIAIVMAEKGGGQTGAIFFVAMGSGYVMEV